MKSPLSSNDPLPQLITACFHLTLYNVPLHIIKTKVSDIYSFLFVSVGSNLSPDPPPSPRLPGTGQGSSREIPN